MKDVSEVLSSLKRVRRSGDGWVASCPSHEDRNPSLSINVGDDGRLLLYCHAGCSFDDIALSIGLKGSYEERRYLPKKRSKYRAKDDVVRPARRDLKALVEIYKSNLPGSIGEVYLAMRGIPLETALSFGLGYSPPGSWRHEDSSGQPVRQGKHGRIVFPHTDPHGNTVNLYGRAISLDGLDEKKDRHDNLVGGKGYFNAQALRSGCGPLYVCEGPFDALSLIVQGFQRTIAIFGIGGWRDSWCRGLKQVILAFDQDDAGRAAAIKLISNAPSYCAKSIETLPEEWYGGEKDINSALVKGVLGGTRCTS